MKKLLAISGVLLISTVPVNTLISCQNNQPSWDNIPVAPPVLPLDVTGFNGVDFKTINPQNKNQTIPELFTDLTNLFKGTKWSFSTLKQKITFKGKEVDDLITLDLYRNGDYQLIFFDDINVNKLLINKIVTTSNNIIDKITTTNIGNIDDSLPKTILIGIIFNNMGIIQELDKFGNFFIGEQNDSNWNKPVLAVSNIEVNLGTKTALLKTNKPAWTEQDDPATQYYGEAKISFNVKSKPNPPNPTDLSVITLVTELGKLPAVTILQIMIVFITRNFAGSLDRLSELLNELYVKISPDQKSALIQAAPGSNNFSNEVVVTFF